MAAAAGLRTIPTGLQHGTVTVIADHEPYEVTTLRRDVTTDGRHAEVAFTNDWALDAARRDLTINAIYADADGTVFDPLGGLADLRDRRIRFVGDPATRIREDYLRILRYFRFFAQYGFGEPDPAGLAACVAGLPGMRRLSPERIHQELVKLLSAPSAVPALDLMIGHGVLTAILPVAPNLERFKRLIAIAPNTGTPLRLAALSMHTIEDADRITNLLRLSNRELATLKLAGSALTSRPLAKPSPAEARCLLYELGPEYYEQHMIFIWTLSNDPPDNLEWRTTINLPNNWSPPALPVTGRDLIATGASPGPDLGRILKHLEKAWLASDFTLNRDELLQTAQALLAKPSRQPE
jgi:tRNA nucleotidyltransferase/poly(A) polymerase